jgi:outer membrane protein assembly factor BamE (lipoprotein component of BamABCDE complex)
VSLLLVVLGFSTACARLSESHGYIPEQTALEDVVVGQDTKATAGLILGRPGTSGIVDDRGWYYVRSDYERFLWRAPVEVNRQVVAVSFDEAGVIENVEQFGLEGGQVVALSRRVTTSNTQGVGFLRQLFSNLGNFDAGQLFGDGS